MEFHSGVTDLIFQKLSVNWNQFCQNDFSIIIKMVFTNSINWRDDQIISPFYANAQFRSQNGYKEQHVPSSVQKYVLYPKGNVNPSDLFFKYIKDLREEDHQFVFKYMRATFAGAITGVLLGTGYMGLVP